MASGHRRAGVGGSHMKKLPQSLDQKLKQAIQSAATEAAPSVDMWISRPTTALVNTEFLEKQNVADGASITDIAVAACHPRVYKPVTKVYVGYVDSGTARVKYAMSKTDMKDHVWFDTGFSETASAIALEFDGTMPKNKKGKVEFVTEELPWVFWIDGGAVYARKLGTATTETLVAANAIDVFAVRGTWSDVGGFDFGLIVFYILSGDIYYQQLIDGVWYDAAPTNFGPAATFVRIAAMRTWDYRVCVQAWDDTGVMYELFTQYQGIGKQNVEHLEITHLTADGDLIDVTYTDTAENENIEIASIDAIGARIYGLSSAPVSAANIDDGLGNYGLYVDLVLDYPVTGTSGNHAAFVLTDENSVTYAGAAISASADGKTLTITFVDFNSAVGDLSLSYTPGTVQSPAVALEAFAFEFTPTGLVPPPPDPPEVQLMYNE